MPKVLGGNTCEAKHRHRSGEEPSDGNVSLTPVAEGGKGRGSGRRAPDCSMFHKSDRQDNEESTGQTCPSDLSYILQKWT